MGREEGGGFRMGNTGIPVADSFRYLAKLIQYCKVKKKKKNIGVGCHFLLQGILPTQEPSLSILLGWQILYH